MESDTVFASPKGSEYHALKEAVRKGDLQQLESVLQQHPGLDINALHPNNDDSEGKTVLHIAAEQGNVESIKRLLDHGVRVDVLDRDIGGDHTPLFDAALRGHAWAVRYLLDAGASVSSRGILEGTPLHAVLYNKRSVNESHVETIKILLDSGASIDAEAPECGGTVLHQAVQLGHIELIKMLVDKGASLEGSLKSAAFSHETATIVNFLIELGAKDQEMSAVSMAAGRGKMEILRALLEHSDAVENTGTSHALHQAACNGHVDIMNYLLGQGFDVNQKDPRGHTPLHTTCFLSKPQCLETVKTLIKRGADTAAKNHDTPHWPWKGGNTPLHLAAWRSDPETVQTLLHADSEVDRTNDEGSTPLIMFASQISCGATPTAAGSNSRVDCLSLLMAAGADVNKANLEGRTALHFIAAEHRADLNNRLEASKLLLTRGARTNVRDIHGNKAEDLLSQRDGELRQVLTES